LCLELEHLFLGLSDNTLVLLWDLFEVLDIAQVVETEVGDHFLVVVFALLEILNELSFGNA